MVSKTRKAAAQASYQQGERKNFIINGDMAICQRATSSSSLGAASGYFVQDRWRISTDNMEGHFTMSQDAEAPDGFANSMKIDCTTAETSTPDVNEYLIVQQTTSYLKYLIQIRIMILHLNKPKILALQKAMLL